MRSLAAISGIQGWSMMIQVVMSTNLPMSLLTSMLARPCGEVGSLWASIFASGQEGTFIFTLVRQRCRFARNY